MNSFFQNRIVARIAITILAQIGMGIFMIICGSDAVAAAGIALALSGALAARAGWTYFKPTPPMKGGVLTIGGRIVCDANGRTIIMRGRVILADYFPFFIGAVSDIEVGSAEWKFDMEILSVEETLGSAKTRLLPLDGNVSMTVAPNGDRMDKFFQAGGSLAAIREEFDKIMYRLTQNVVREKRLSAIQISLEGADLSAELERLSKDRTTGPNGLFQKLEDFGLVCTQIQADFLLPSGIKDSMIDAGSIQYESAARALENQADIDAANALKEKTGTSFEDALQSVIELRLVRDGQVSRLQIEGKGTNVGTLVIQDAKITMGGGGQKPAKSK